MSLTAIHMHARGVMDLQERKTLDRFTRAIKFIDTNPPVLANVSPGFTTQVQTLRDAVATINTIAPDRGSGTPKKTANQRAVLRNNLRVGQLYPIRRVARVLERTIAGMPHLVNIPGRIANTTALLDAAKAAARDVAPYKDQFIAKGMSSDFLDRLNTAIQALENSDQANMTARMAAMDAKGKLAQAFQTGRDALTLMDSVIRNECNENPTLGAGTLLIWNTIVPAHGKTSSTPSAIATGTTEDVQSAATASTTPASTTPASTTPASTA